MLSPETAARHKKWRADNPEKSREYVRRWAAKASPAYHLYNLAKKRAKHQGAVFNLDKADIAIPELCPLLEIPLIRGARKLGPNSPTLDRIDPNKGYIKGNVWVISHKANTIKSNATPEEILLLATNLAERFKQIV